MNDGSNEKRSGWSAALSRHARWIARIGAAACLAFYLVTGALGLDYGTHWDEWYQIQGIKNAVTALALWPQEYAYSGFYYVPGYVVLGLHERETLSLALTQMRNRGAEWHLNVDRYPALLKLRTEATAFLDTNDYKVQTRFVFLLVASLTILWSYLAARELFRKEPFVGLASAAFVACSWEALYHARFIAVDASVMQFAAAQMCALAFAYRARAGVRALLSLLFAGLAGGLAFGCKTTAVFLFLPCALGALAFRTPFRSIPERIGLLAGVAFAFFVGFILVSPATLMDPFRYLSVVFYQKLDYNSVGPGYPYYVQAPFEHLGRMLWWLFGSVPSHYFALAVPFAVLALLGARRLFVQHRALVIVWAVWALAFVFVFTANKLLTVRNFLMFIPFLSLAFGAGVLDAFERLRARDERLALGLVGFVVLGLFVNAGWQAHAALTIRATTPQTIVRDAADYLASHPGAALLSPKSKRALEPLLGGKYTCESGPVGTAPPRDERVVVFFDEHDPRAWLSNRPWFVQRTFGSLEVNYDWHATWKGKLEHDRILVLSRDHAADTSLDVSAFTRCSPR